MIMKKLFNPNDLLLIILSRFYFSSIFKKIGSLSYISPYRPK
jgi:hypothetical protein